ncbi:MAG: bifunctional phosphopantothenoylcysteine decarboxylase/phosphopantothenate--cysteine ligase CoaBC [Candidatus Marinimicrobia bacterium]|nr:bifunctional phosphopantothenoylcysteine decarboxylase/phosphopantothenate--cysteine ligase CoaBC [Candidatus Neomarinimicrobiota bacterium]
MRLSDRKLLFGITGSIASYKAVYIVRHLVKNEGAQIQVVMTKAATEFVRPVVFETVTGSPVYVEMFGEVGFGTVHIDLARESDLLVICPATANIIAKIACGIADDLLSSVALVKGSNMVIAPAMNDQMYLNPITQDNISKLKRLGCVVVECEEGDLACGTTGIGRLAEEKKIILAILRKLREDERLKGKKVVVTAGPTREYIDDIRFISNRSTGKMGFAIAEEALIKGAEVVLISGPNSLERIPYVNYIEVETAEEMLEKLLEHRGADYLFMASAIEDLVPDRVEGKIKKKDGVSSINIKYAPDVVKSFREKSPGTTVVGFSVEVDNAEENTRKKLEEKGLDFIAWNSPDAFASDFNDIVLYSRSGKRWHLPKGKKNDVAQRIIDIVVQGG